MVWLERSGKLKNVNETTILWCKQKVVHVIKRSAMKRYKSGDTAPPFLASALDGYEW
jgi:hypothetical protein